MAPEFTNPLLILVCGLTFAAAWPAQAAPQAGEVVIARGVTTAHQPSAAGRIVGAGSPVLAGDIITTGPRSLALLKLADGTRVTLRPETTFQIEKFSIAAEDAGAVYRLFKGGLRAVTGFLSKRNPNSVSLRTAVATIGIRGTEFDARLCGADCAAEAKVHALPAGRAGFVKGNVVARSKSGDRARALVAGGPIYSGDTVLTSPKSYTVLSFQDKSRVTLLPETEFRVEQLTFDQAKPEEGQGIFALLRGGLRAVSGAIGHYRPNAYQMRTAVATIGIRGTGYDLATTGTGQNVDPNPAPGGDGTYVQVWDGSITVGVNNTVLNEGQASYVGTPGMDPVNVPSMPIPFDVPKPADVQISEPPPPPAGPGEGLIVGCYEGTCAMKTDQNEVNLTAGQAGFVGTHGGPAQQLTEIPPFMPEDPALRAVEENSSLNLLDQTLDGGGSECSVN